MSSLTLAVTVFLGVSLLFYVLFGGADFGAGILELFLGSKKRDEQRKLISHAMAPVWEANHVWLILAVVILFMGFPRLYTLVSTYLHIPILAILVGIVARGCAFTFRHYDTLGKEYYRAYSRVFALSSLWTSFFLGVGAGAVMLGRFTPDALSFEVAYIRPWFNWFCASVGLFACALFSFLAAIYLVGEANDAEMRGAFRRKALLGNVAVVVAGALVFVSAEVEGFGLARSFFTNPLTLACFVLATLLWLPFWKALANANRTVATRALGAAIVALVLFGWFAVRYKLVVQILESAAAPERTLKALLGALVVGCVLIFPALGYLLKVFKWESIERERAGPRTLP